MKRSHSGATNLAVIPRPSLAAQIAIDSLRANILNLDSGPYLLAGQNQYKTIWTRDFCYSIRGLLHIQREDVIENQLQKLINFARPKDGLIPRVIDSVAVQFRVVWNSVRSAAGNRIPNLKFQEPLRPQYMDEHTSVAMDSNVLLILNTLRYVKSTKNDAFLNKNTKQLEKIFLFYRDRIDRDDGFLIQQKFSDWQDSVKREGKTFYLNHLYWWLLSELADFNLFGVTKKFAVEFGQRLIEKFYSKENGIFKSIIDHPYYSLDGNLMVLESGLLNMTTNKEFYSHLKKSKIWKDSDNKIPGFNTYPRYPNNWHHIPVKLVGLMGYHDHVYWSWLLGYATWAARFMNDTPEFQFLKRNLEKILERDKTVYEIYHPKGLLPWSSKIYKSESPFSWGASYIIQALGD